MHNAFDAAIIGNGMMGSAATRYLGAAEVTTDNGETYHAGKALIAAGAYTNQLLEHPLY